MVRTGPPASIRSSTREVAAVRTRSTATSRHRAAAALGACIAALLAVVSFGGSAGAAIVPTVGLGTSADFSVLAGSTVTNTGPSVLAASAGVSPGTAIVGFPPGIVTAPGTLHAADAPAAQAQADLTAAYDDAAGRSVDATTPDELGNQTLGAGVYASTSGSFGITGPLVLDGAGDPTSVFIFKSSSTLVTASASTVSLVNGAQECNVFWQVGSSATLGTASVFRGNILALTSITATTGATVHGRALARNGAVTLDTNTFVSPTCAVVPPTTTSVSTSSSTTAMTSTTTASTTASSVPASTTSSSTVPAALTPAPGGGQPVAPASEAGAGQRTHGAGPGSGQVADRLANTGAPIGLLAAAGASLVLLGIGALHLARHAP